MGQRSPSSCVWPHWFVMLFQIVLVVKRCKRLVKVVGHCFSLIQDVPVSSGSFYDDSSCFRCVKVVLGGFLVVLGCCTLFQFVPRCSCFWLLEFVVLFCRLFLDRF